MRAISARYLWLRTGARPTTGRPRNSDSISASARNECSDRPLPRVTWTPGLLHGTADVTNDLAE